MKTRGRPKKGEMYWAFCTICEQMHRTKIEHGWTGRGIPRMFCSDCRVGNGMVQKSKEKHYLSPSYEREFVEAGCL